MTIEIETPAASAALAAFAANAYAFREPVRVAARALLAETVLRAAAGGTSERVAFAAAGIDSARARLHAHPIGRRERMGPIDAALLDALAVGDDATLATPAACAALALGEGVDASGATVLDAVVAGAEVAVRVARALGAGHAARGWDARGTAGRLGAAVAAGRVVGLAREPMRQALGIAATAAGGLLSAHGTMTAALIVAGAAADGVEAALLARAEFTAAPRSLEGRRGLAALMSPAFDLSALLEGLGETFVYAALVAPQEAAFRGARADAIRAVLTRLERLPSLAELLAAASS